MSQKIAHVCSDCGSTVKGNDVCTTHPNATVLSILTENSGIDPRVYLGDSVYAAFEDGGITLTTENGFGPSNKIYLDPEVYASLLAFVQYLKARADDEVSNG